MAPPRWRARSSQARSSTASEPTHLIGVERTPAEVCPPFSHEVERPRHLVDRGGHSEKSALGGVAAEFGHGVELGFSLNALGDDFDIEDIGQGDDRRDYSAIVGSIGNVGHKAPVDFQHVERIRSEPIDGQKAGAEIVERNADTDASEGAEIVLGDLAGLHDRRLGDLDDQVVGVESGLLGGERDAMGVAGTVELTG